MVKSVLKKQNYYVTNLTKTTFILYMYVQFYKIKEVVFTNITYGAIMYSN